MSDQNSRTRAQHRKGSASQTSEEDVGGVPLFFSCDQAALWMVQSVCLSVHHTLGPRWWSSGSQTLQNHPVWEQGPPGWIGLITSRGQVPAYGAGRPRRYHCGAADRDTETEGGSRWSGTVRAAEQHLYLGHPGACPQGWRGRGHNTSSCGTRQRGPQGRPTPPTQRHWGEPQIEEAPTCQRRWTKADNCTFPLQEWTISSNIQPQTTQRL